MNLVLLPMVLSVCRLAPEEAVPRWVLQDRSLVSITYTRDELSVVCPARSVPAMIQCESGWRALQVQGPLDFALTGILAALATPLAAANIPIFALSTFDTDYLLVKAHHVERARAALQQHGHVFVVL